MRHFSEVQERVYRGIRHRLLQGGLRSPKELSCRRLSQDLGVSPSSVLNVLGRLKTEGLLVTRPQGGTVLRQLSEEEFHRLYDLREMIEPYAAARAARFKTSEQVKRLELSCRELTGLLGELRRCPPDVLPPDYTKRYLAIEHAFHGTVLEAARAPEAAHMLENYRILSFLSTYTSHWPRPKMLSSMELSDSQQQSITDAIRKGDARRARVLMRRHLTTGFYGRRGLVPPTEQPLP